MMSELNALLAATILFVGGHFLLSSQALRPHLVARLGEGGFRGLYSAVAAVSLAWMSYAYAHAPLVELWHAPALRWLPLVLLPIAAVLAVAGLTTRSPTAVGGESLAGEGDPAPGILRITRHPFLWGVALWAFAHLAANGDVASLAFFGGFLVLSLGGMQHIDHRRERTLGSAWGPMKLTTSVLPFAAIATRRTTMDWRGLGWWRPLLGLVLYLALLHLHPLLFSASPLP
ncbi:MAG: NnrU family protein [Tistlia sp.]|uniref:NnrU family protein n=1 Tax=Tistlia sp. TaxID=3057121 RepID=UPI0034A2F2D6